MPVELVGDKYKSMDTYVHTYWHNLACVINFTKVSPCPKHNLNSIFELTPKLQGC